MSVFNPRTSLLIGLLFLVSLIWGCGLLPGIGDKSKKLAPDADLGTTIGSLVQVVTPESIPVEGYGLVGGLHGTGSAECPPAVREYLRRYILAQLPEGKIDVEKFISSRETAVVRVESMMPAPAWKGQSFNVRVLALPGTQTTSLENGWLYGAELRARGTFGIATRVLADAEGPVFIDKITASQVNKKLGYILAGGKVRDEYNVSLALRRPDYRVASRIRNRLNERYGYGMAHAVSSGRVELAVPDSYKAQSKKFIATVKATYLGQTAELIKKRITALVRKLAVSEDKYASEVALEAIGNESLDKLRVLLNSSDEEVRLRTARCMLNLGSDQGLQALTEIAMDESSAFRIEALEAITLAATRGDAAAIARRLLHDSDFSISLAAYEQLRKLDDIAVTQERIARGFFLEQVAKTKHKAVYVSRSGEPRIVLFGAPISCRDNIFIQSPDGEIVINSSPGQKHVSLIRKHPKRPSIITHLESSFDLADVVRGLCEEPVRTAEGAQRGLGVSYADVIVLLKLMCDKGAVLAEFHAGPPPKIG